MRRKAALLASVLTLCGASSVRVTSQATPDEPIVTTSHQVAIDGRTLSYTARAGRLPIRDNETGDVHGQMFFVSYTLDSPPSTPRPLTFVWNGGPGSSSSLVHLLGFGPKVVRPGRPPFLIKVRGSTLPTSCSSIRSARATAVRPGLNTARSSIRPAATPNLSASSYAYIATASKPAVAAVSRRRELRRSTRAAGVADVLQRRRIQVSGVILIGLALPLGELSEELRAALMVPTYTAAAFVHKKLAPDLQKDMTATLAQAEKWAETEYAPALAKRDSLPEEDRRRVLAQLARFTGLDPGVADAKTLTIGMPQFTQHLLRHDKLVVGRYDSRLTGPSQRQGRAIRSDERSEPQGHHRQRVVCSAI